MPKVHVMPPSVVQLRESSTHLRRFPTGTTIIIPKGAQWYVSSIYCIPPSLLQPPYPDVPRFRGDIVLRIQNKEPCFRANARALMDKYWKLAAHLSESGDKILERLATAVKDLEQADQKVAAAAVEAFTHHYREMSPVTYTRVLVPELYQLSIERWTQNDQVISEPSLEVQLHVQITRDAGSIEI